MTRRQQILPLLAPMICMALMVPVALFAPSGGMIVWLTVALMWMQQQRVRSAYARGELHALYRLLDRAMAEARGHGGRALEQVALIEPFVHEAAQRFDWGAAWPFLGRRFRYEPPPRCEECGSPTLPIATGTGFRFLCIAEAHGALIPDADPHLAAAARRNTERISLLE